MHGFQMNDQRGVEGTGFVKAVRSLLTFHLPQFIPTMQSTIAEQLSFEFSRQASRGGRISFGQAMDLTLIVNRCSGGFNFQLNQVSSDKNKCRRVLWPNPCG